MVADPDAVAAYAKVCGFALRDSLPPTYPHVLAFPLHMALMSDGAFPFGAVGLVHIANRITQYRRLGTREELSLRVQATKIAPHPKGRSFDVVTEARVGRQIAWESTSTFLRRGKGDPGASSGEAFPIVAEDAAGERRVDAPRRPRPPLRRRLRRPQPDPHALADREAARLPGARSRTGCGPRRRRWRRSSRACPTPSPSTSASAGRSCCRPRSSSQRKDNSRTGSGRIRWRGDRLHGARPRQEARRPSPRRPGPAGQSQDQTQSKAKGKAK